MRMIMSFIAAMRWSWYRTRDCRPHRAGKERGRRNAAIRTIAFDPRLCAPIAASMGGASPIA